ncbi:lamin tail domain-containing protein, partial [bacterium]|nr:lamin tail domain-containing protein [candidate division CSSED10-310 bacterium]
MKSKTGFVLLIGLCIAWVNVFSQNITINEMYINPPGTDVGCYVELYYPGGISLDGYSLVGVNGYNGSDYQSIALDGYSIPADGYFVIAQDASVSNADLIDSNVNYQNGPDNIQLRDGSDVVDAIGYGDFLPTEFFAGEGSPAPAYFTGEHSHSRIPDGNDTNDNSVDFQSGNLTPGTMNIPESTEPTNTPGPPTATAGPPTATPTGPTPTPPPVENIKINEMYINPPGTDVGCYVELYYPGGISLDGYSLVGVNGNNGSDYQSISLDGYSIPADGYFLIAQDASVSNADLIDSNVNYQNGPDNIQLRNGAVVVDAIGYGDFLPTEFFAGEGSPAPAFFTGDHSHSRIPDGNDTDDNSVDFVSGELTPGEMNIPEAMEPTMTPTGPPPPTATPTGPTPTPPPIYNLKINEIHVNPDGQDLGCYIELYYPGSHRISLDGYTLVGINGYDNTEYNIVPLTGEVMAGDYFVIAQDDSVANADLIDVNINYQNGPDSIQLRAGSTVVDAIGYGTFLPEEFFAGEGDPVDYPNPTNNLSLNRIPDGTDTDNNFDDFVLGILTPGEQNQPAGEPTHTP